VSLADGNHPVEILGLLQHSFLWNHISSCYGFQIRLPNGTFAYFVALVSIIHDECGCFGAAAVPSFP
jgi:hypothetical protein